MIRVLTAPMRAHRRDHGRTGEPVTFGVPLPPGFAAAAEGWAASTPSRGWQAVQTHVLDRWADGSARWVLVDAQIDPETGERGGFDLDVTGQHAATTQGIEASETASGVVVNTKAATFELRPGTGVPFAAVARNNAGLVGPDACRLTAIDRHGASHDAKVTRVTVESLGFLRTVVRLDGELPVGDGRSLVLICRVHFFAGLSTVRVSLTLRNPEAAVHRGGFWDLGDSGSVLIEDVSLSIALGPNPGQEVRCSREPHAPLEPFARPFEIYQDSSGGERWKSSNHVNRQRQVPLSFRGYRVRSGTLEQQGLRSTPIVLVPGETASVGVAVRDFWQNFPKAIEVSESALTVRLFPKQFNDLHEIQGGEQKTHESWMMFGDDHVSPLPLDWCRTPTLACVDPAWTIASAAVPFLAPLQPDHEALVQAAIEGEDRFELKREIIDQYGWRNFGEIYGDHESVRQKDPPIVSHYNNQYDPIAGFILEYLRSADPRWWTMADELASHVTDIDIYHTTRDKSAYNGGMFWHTYHYGDAGTATHRTYPASDKGRTHGGGPSADHNYTTGLMLHHFLTGERSSREAVIGLGQYVIDLDDGTQTVFRWLDRGDTGRAILSNGYYGPGRGPANSLNALLDAHRIGGDAAMFRKAEQIVRRVVHPNDDISRHRLDDPEARWFYVMFLQSLGKYLTVKAERREFDEAYAYGRDSLIHYAEWMAKHEYPYLDKPEKLEFPTETWAAQDIRKSDVLYYASRYVSGTQRATFEERAAFFHANSIRSLAAAPTRALARPVIVLLTSGFMHSGRGLLAAPPDQPAVPKVDYGTYQVFEPQRVRAERLAKRLGVIAAMGMLLIVWFLLRR